MAGNQGANFYLDAIRAVTGTSTEKQTGTPKTAGEAIIQKIQNDPTNQKRANIYTGRGAGDGQSGGLQLGQWEADPTRPGTMVRQVIGRDTPLTNRSLTGETQSSEIKDNIAKDTLVPETRGPSRRSTTSRSSTTNMNGKIREMQSTAQQLQTQQNQATIQKTMSRYESQRKQYGEDRKKLLDELNEMERNSGYVADPDEANRQEERRAEIIRTLEAGDAAAGYGPQSYGAADRARNVFGAATGDYLSGLINRAGTDLVTLYENVDTNPYAGWATDEITASQIRPERDEEALKQYEYLKTGGEKLQEMADRLGENAAKDLEQAKAGLGSLGKAGVDIATNLIQMGYDAAAGQVLGSGLISMYARSAGSAAREARLNGANTGEQFWYGATKGGIEVGTELLGNGVSSVLSKVYGKGIADDITEEVIRKVVRSDTGRSLARFLAGAAGEGIEEAISDLLSPIAEKIYNRQDSLGQLYRNMDPAEVIYDFLIGTAIGSLGSAMGFVNGENRAANEELRARDAEEASGLTLGATENVGDAQAAAEKDQEDGRRRTEETVQAQEDAALAETAREVTEKPYEEMTDGERKEAFDKLYDQAKEQERLSAEEGGNEEREKLPRISMEDYANNDSSVWNHVEVDDVETQNSIQNQVHERMIAEGKAITVPQETIDRVAEYFPNLRHMKKADRNVILKDKVNTLKAAIRKSLRQLTGTAFEFEVNGNVIEARLYETGIKEVIDNLRQDNASMLLHTEEIFKNAEYMYSTPDYEDNPDIYRWNYFYAPVKIDGDTVGVRVAVRDMIRSGESQIYNWGIKKNPQTVAGAGRDQYRTQRFAHKSEGSTEDGSMAPNNSIVDSTDFNLTQAESTVNQGNEEIRNNNLGGTRNETVEQNAAQEEQGLLGQTETQPAAGEQSLRVGAADEGTAGAGTAPAVTAEGTAASDGSGQRNAGGRTGGEAGRLDPGTGRGITGADGEGRRTAGQSIGDVLRRSGARQISSREIGLKTGTDKPTFYEVPDEMLTPELRDMRYGYSQSTGCDIQFVAGPIQVMGSDGRVRNVRGFYDAENRRIVVQIDHNRYEPVQILRHEQFHALADRDPGLVEATRDRVIQRFGRSELERIVRGYVIARRGINDIEGTVDAMDDAALEILEEIFADANGWMNAFGLKANRLAFTTWKTLNERQDNQRTNGPRQTRGPPERYSYAEETNVNSDPNTHTTEQMKAITEYQQAVDEDLVQFALDALLAEEDKANGMIYDLKPASDRMINDVERLLGIDASGYSNKLQGNQLKHIDIRHGAGAERESNRTLADLKDLGRLQYVLDNYDSAAAGKKSKGYRTNLPGSKQGPARTIQFKKKIDGTYYVVEAVPETKAKSMYIVSAVIKNNPGGENAADANAPTRTAKTEGSQAPGAEPTVPQSVEESKQKFSLDEDQVTMDEISGGEMERSTWDRRIREKTEEAIRLTEDVKEYFRNIDEADENWIGEEDIDGWLDFSPYGTLNDIGDMNAAGEVLDRIRNISMDQTGEAREESFLLMERLLPHLSAEDQQNFTRRGSDTKDAFSRWYDRRHPSLYYPGYQPGDLFDAGSSDFWQAQENQEKEKEYLRGLLDSGKLMEPELTEARDFLRRLEDPHSSEVFYSMDEDNIREELNQVTAERDELNEFFGNLYSQEGAYRLPGSDETYTEDEVRDRAFRLEQVENRYNELTEIASKLETQEAEALEASEPETDETGEDGLRVGEQEEEVGGQTTLPEDEKDRTIRELQEMNRQLEKYAEYWKKQGRITGEGEQKAKRSDVQRIARDLAEHAEFMGDRAGLQEKVQALADYVVSNNRGYGMSWNEVREKAGEIAAELVDNSYTVLDPEKDTRNALRSRLKELKIRPDPMWTGDIGDWNSFRKQQIGKLTFSKEGQDIDTVYQTLNGEFGEGLFPSDITAGSDQVNRILEALDSLGEQRAYNFADPTEAEMAEAYYTNRITDELLFGNLGEELTRADRNYQRVKQRMNRAEQQLREVKREAKQKIRSMEQMQRNEVRAALQKQREDIRGREEKQKLRKRIDQTGKRLIKYLTENSGKNPIPEPLKESVGKVLLDLDLSGGMEKHQKERYLWNMQEIAKAVAEQNAYMAGVSDEWNGMYLDLPSDIQKELNEHLADVKKAMDEAEARGRVWNPNMMGVEELQRLDEILTVLSSAITNANELLSDARGAKVSEEASEGIREIDSLGADRERKKLRNMMNNFLRFQNTTPYYFFKRLGKAGQRVFERIQDGWDKFAMNAKQVVDFANDTYTAEEAKEIQESIHTFHLRRRGDLSAGFDKPETVTMSKAQIMSLYCLWKRPQAQGHILGAGIRIADYEDGKRTVTQAENYLIDPADLTEMFKVLTPRDREIADALQKYMNTVGSDWGNEVSMKRFGIRSFTEENYFPIRTDDRSRPPRSQESDTANLYRLLNMSFTKNTTRNASNSIVLDNIFDVFANHMADMAKYNGLGLPMLDAMKWFSFSQTSELNEAGQYGYESVQKSAERAFGKEAQKYFITFMQDLNGVKEGGRGEELGSRALSSYKVAAVGANLRVALLQPTSYLRAGAVLDRKYLIKGLSMNNRQGREEAAKWSGTAVWKDLGFYDTNINAGLREMIKHTDGLKEQVQEVSMKGAELGDKVTWGAIWNACRAEQEEKGLAGDELMAATANRFREVIYRTQVMDSTMTRSHVMRQKGAYAGMVTAFMSEPTLSYNMLLDAYTSYENETRRNMEGKDPKDKTALKEAREKAWKKSAPIIQKTAGAYFATAILSAVAESLVDAARDDDEYATYLERFAEKLLGINLKDPDATTWENIKAGMNGNLMQDLLVHNKLPVIKDFFAMLSGQSTSRMDTEWMASIIKAGEIAYESLRLKAGWQDEPTKITYNGNMTGWGKIYNGLRAVSQLTGLPIGNAIRDGVAIWNSTVGEISQGMKIQTYDPGPEKKIQYAVKDGYLTEDEAIDLLLQQELAEDENDARQKAYFWAHPDEYERMLAAMNAGDKAEFEAAQGELEDLRFKQSRISTAVSGEIEKRYLGEEEKEPVDRATAVQMLMEYGGMIERKAEEQVQKWSCELETGIPYSGISDAYTAGDITREQAKDMLVTYGGMAEEKAEAQVQKWTCDIETGIAYSEIGDMFFYGDITQEEAVDMYMKYGGKSQEDAENEVNKIAFRKATGRERERTDLQDMYIRGDYSRDEMKNMMLEYGYSKTEESAEDSLIRWDFIGDDIENLDAVTPWQAKRWFSDLEAAEIDKKAYLDFVEQVKDIKADVDENGKSIMGSKMDKIFAVIDSLDLTPEQKDALAMAGWDSSNDGYSEKNLSRAPWHDGETTTKKSSKKKSGGGGGRRGGGGGGRGKSSGGALSLGAAFEAPASGKSGMFEQVLKMWKRRKYTRAAILAMVRAGKLTQEEADEILATEQTTDEENETDGSLTLGAADELKESA